MKKLTTLSFAVLCIAAVPALAGDDQRMHKNMQMNMKTMDANSDGMISRDEFMRFHEKRWGELKKNSSGMVDMKEMHSMQMRMWSDDKDSKMEKSDKTDKDK